jgi:hypothetical protein
MDIKCPFTGDFQGRIIFYYSHFCASLIKVAAYPLARALRRTSKQEDDYVINLLYHLCIKETLVEKKSHFLETKLNFRSTALDQPLNYNNHY